MEKRNDYKTRTIKTTDDRTITYFNGVLHSWEGPAIKYGSSYKKKDEYYLYGFKKSKDEWTEARRDRNGVSPDKSSSVNSRY